MTGLRVPRVVTSRATVLRSRRLHASTSSRPSPRVLVVGGGPVGLAMGYLLDRVYGVPTRIIERQAAPTTHPQAHFLNLRTMEVLHATMPAFHDQLLDQAAPSDLWRDYIYTTGVGRAREFARIDQFGSNIPRPLATKQQLLDALDGLSPTQFLHFPQNRFETMLSTFVEESGMRVERQVELVDLKPTSPSGGPVNVKLRCARTQQEEHASFDYVIGADGAHSLVRQLSGIDMVGTRNLQSIANVHFTSTALSQAARENPAMLYFVFNENVIGVLIAHDLSRGEWVFQIPFFPPQESIAQDFFVDQCKQLVRHLLTQPGDDDVSILSVGQWQMSARVAKQYDADRRVFLVGDAAHQFPPAGGFGMNTGVQDAHNLAWKLAWALQCQDKKLPLPVDEATLLRSYERERQLVAKLNTQLSLRNVERTMKIPSALNVSHNNAKLLEAIVNAAPVKFLPLSLQREAIQRVMTLGKKPLALLDSARSALGERMRRHVREIVAQRASLGMLFYHFDIGFSYDTTHWGARAKQLMGDDALNHSAQFSLSDDTQEEEGVYTPQFEVGVRFPHLWCEVGDKAKRISTVALEALVREQSSSPHDVQFVLVVDETQWPALQLQTGDDHDDLWRHVTVVSIGVGDAPTVDSSTSGGRARVVRLRVDPSAAASLAQWNQFTARHAAALVRPDGHIAALVGREATSDTTALDVATLRRAMQCAASS